MKKIIFLMVLTAIFTVHTTSAQSFLDKIDKAVNKIDRASNSADKASKTGNKVMSLLGGKNKENVASTQTVIKITGIDLATLKAMNEIVETIKGVEASKMKFNAAQSTITVNHAGATDDFLSQLQPKAKAVFGDEHVTVLEDGLIEIQLK